jgi:hypothetical protein
VIMPAKQSTNSIEQIITDGCQQPHKQQHHTYGHSTPKKQGHIKGYHI